MKWKNKGYELDKEAEKILEKFKKVKKIDVFGAGIIGSEVKKHLKYLDCFGCYIDNNIEKQENGVEGVEVTSLNSFLQNRKERILIVAVGNRNIKDICEQLNNSGLGEGEDYFLWNRFLEREFPLIAYYYYKKIYANLTQISVTERCTLRCEKCAHGCPYNHNKSHDLTYEEVCQSADAYFEYVDICKEFVLIGGEPLLYNKLDEAIEYVGRKYRNKMFIFSITTNGTIIPSSSVIKACEKHKVLFKISNYSANLPYLKEKYEQLMNVLAKNHIEFELGNPELNWFDYGFDYQDRGEDNNRLIYEFDRCKTPCHEIRRDKYYFCVMARSVSENMGFKVGKDDYLDLSKLPKEDGKKLFLEYNMGFSEKGYLEMCRYCNGADAKNYLIPSAEQLKN